ncbi:MAG TPA: DNA/RNA helicase domain-containing protein [Thermoleophilia bacterium]|nr:DNA/RNA helicase domain-containing protein [Thermoleophilia bacterium]
MTGDYVSDKDASRGWHGSVAEFLAASEADLLAALRSRHLQVMGMPPDGGQMEAWRGEYSILSATLGEIVASTPRAKDWAVIFEYELPRERGRRPDVVILTGSQVMVLEFKESSILLQAHVDQVAAYARDLRHYHAGSHDKLVDPLLVLTRSPVERQRPDGRQWPEGRRGAGMGQGSRVEQDMAEVEVVNPQGLRAVLAELERRAPDEPIDAEAWINADYSPLPSLVSAARRIFEHEPLPQIKKAQSAGIPDTIATIVAAANQAREAQELHLALITGVPGSGKTLVGLQFVYENHFGDTGSERSAVFLSGNGPLVEVLQYALRSRVFVQDVHGFLKQYGGSSIRTPEEHVWVYDEAQRAWDAERVKEKRGHDRSEPEDFLHIGSRKDSWALMVGLIGEGQEIHLGEEAGLKQWNDAIRRTSDSWTVHCPGKIASIFNSAERLHINESLDLDTSLRTHLAEDVQGWVQDLLDGRLDAAAAHAEAMEKQGFRLYLTRDLERARRYVRERYRTEEDKRYGFLGSSKGRLNRFGIPTDYQDTKRLRAGPWYYDHPDTVGSCCQLDSAATEFQCQGLELDLPIVGWGVDLHWSGRSWQSRPQRRSQARDPHKLRLNSYRVLLTRGRDGLVLYVPDGGAAFDADFAALEAGGGRGL